MKTIQENAEKEFDRMILSRTENQKGIANIIFFVGTGLFVLSINYVSGLHDAYLNHIWLLILSWLFIVISIAFHATGYMIADRRAMFICEKINDWALNNYEPNDYKASKEPESVALRKKALGTLYLAIIFLVLGVITMTLFASTNLIIRNDINNKTINTETKEPIKTSLYKVNHLDFFPL